MQHQSDVVDRHGVGPLPMIALGLGIASVLLTLATKLVYGMPEGPPDDAVLLLLSLTFGATSWCLLACAAYAIKLGGMPTSRRGTVMVLASVVLALASVVIWVLLNTQTMYATG